MVHLHQGVRELTVGQTPALPGHAPNPFGMWNIPEGRLNCAVNRSRLRPRCASRLPAAERAQRATAGRPAIVWAMAWR
jgi:hypothetical protein